MDTPAGDWYAVLFQDHGAVGRIPVLVPVTWDAALPVFGKDRRIPAQFKLPCKKADEQMQPLVQCDDFKKPALSEAQEREQYGCYGLKSIWQFNHEPDLRFVKADTEQGILWLTAGKRCQNLLQAANILTQRMYFPRCAGSVTVDARALKVGDYAGICALQGCYGMIAITRRSDGFYVVMRSRAADNASLQAMPEDNADGVEWEAVPVQQGIVHLKIEAEFMKMQDEARFFMRSPVQPQIVRIQFTVIKILGSSLASHTTCILRWTIFPAAVLGCLSMPQRRLAAGQDFQAFSII